MARWKVLLIGLVLVIGYGLAGNADIQNEQAEQTRYCEMLELWNETDGDAGWPPYNGKCED